MVVLSSFNLFSSLFQRIDQVTATFVTDISQKTIVAITPVVTVGLTLTFIAYGLLIIRGAVEMPVTEFIARSLRIAIIISIALAGGLYQSDIAGLIGSVTDDLASALVSGQEGDAGKVIDTATGHGLDRAGEAFNKGGFFVENGYAYYVLAAIIFMVTGFLAAVGGAFIILAKVALAVLAGLGPLFIVAMLFQPTYRFFELWLGQVVNYGLLIVLFAIVFGLIMSIYGNYIANITFDGQQNVWYAVGGVLALGLASAVIVLQLPGIASGLAGGVGLSYYWELRSLRNLAGSARRSAGAPARAWSAGQRAGVIASNSTIAQRAGAAARGVSGAARAGYQRAAGYFRGSRGGAVRGGGEWVMPGAGMRQVIVVVAIAAVAGGCARGPKQPWGWVREPVNKTVPPDVVVPRQIIDRAKAEEGKP